MLIGVLKGATIFLADLARAIKLDVSFDFIAVSSYGNDKQHSGEVKLIKDVDHSMEGKNVILVEDILDTGITLTYIRNLLRAHQPKSFKIAALAGQEVAPGTAHSCRLCGISRSPMNLSWDMDLTLPSDIVICQMSVCWKLL